MGEEIMGLDASIYLGPLVVVPEQVMNIEGTLYCCSNNSCKRHNESVSTSEKFCSKCGSVNTERTVSKKEILNPYLKDSDKNADDWVDLFVDNNVDGRIIYVPNFDLDGKDIFNVYDSERYSEFEHDLGAVNFEKNIQKFKELSETKQLVDLLLNFYKQEEIVISYRLFKQCR